ncbi:granulocyte-macrophage colony-stimulating factor receptor subunit alpha-like [Hyperolius riggenbachi]|uniref:granulocyte-macrophage colony-stimulating factor receptor subunit alpha-like n=1 Tax=Hyperolius riggenbachi TaxID=752182 RepID=UPI0035A26F66
MVHPSYLSLFIALWFSVELQCKDTVNTENELLSNVEIRLSPGFITVTWDCNKTKAVEDNTYEMQYNTSHNIKLNFSECFYEEYIPKEMCTPIHNGLNVTIEDKNISRIYKVVPEGKENTAADNFSCIIYNVSIINCSWTAGKEAPQDTQYSLVFRNKTNNVSCRDYQLDSFRRQVGCVLRHPDINFDKRIYVELVGSSNQASVRFFDAIWKLNDKVILDPPQNIKTKYTSDGLIITWDRPETHTDQKEICFQYSININGKVENTSTKRYYLTKNMPLNEKAMVSLRVKWTSRCSSNENWSSWSKLHEAVPDSTGFTQNHLLIVLGLVTAVGLLVAIFLCHRFQIWKRLFPKVPQPAMKFFDQAEEAGILDKNMLEEEMLCKKVEEDEECICLHIKEETPQELSEITE